MKIDSRTGILMVVAVVIIAFIILYATLMPGRNGSTSSTTPVSTTPPATFATQGELVSGFPSGLVLDANAEVKKSYSIDYTSGDKQYTAVWSSASSVPALFSAYTSYAKDNGWTIENQDISNSAVNGFYAVKASSSLSVAVALQNAGLSQVTIGYLTPQ